MTDAQAHASDLFCRMEIHVNLCGQCNQVEGPFRAALERKDYRESERLAHEFCREMNALGEEFHAAMTEAFGSAG